MKIREIFRFELAYQARRVSTWLLFAVLLGVAFLFIKGNNIYDARNGDYLLNSPYSIAQVTVFGCLLWLLVAAAIAGEAAARDVKTRMDPLIYTLPVHKAEYLGGRFLAAFVLNATILLAVPVGILLAVRSPGVEAEILGPFRPAVYLGAYLLIALPNAFVVTAIQFSLATLRRRVLASYLGSVLLFVTAQIVTRIVAASGLRELTRLVDPIGVITIVSTMANTWTPAEKNTRLIGLEGSLLANRLVWLGLAVGMLAFTYRRFRFGHPETSPRRSRRARRREEPSPTAVTAWIASSTPIRLPPTRRTFGFPTHVRQTLAIARDSFRKVAKSRSGLVLLTVIALLAVLSVLGHLQFMGVPLVPRAELVLTALVAPEARPGPWIVIPLLIVVWAGELVWREREAGLSEITDAAPVPEWVLLLGKLLGLGLMLVACLALLMTVGMLLQVGLGDPDLEIGRYLQVLFGLQLPQYLLLAVLALAIHVLVDQRHVGYLVAVVGFATMVFAYQHRIVEHHLLVYGTGPGWSYTEMRGFGPSLGPWMWFELYWAAWALLLAVGMRLLWVRGSEQGLAVRLRRARRRFTHPTKWTATAAAGLILTLGGFIFYNTNILNTYATTSGTMERHAEYERRYGRYANLPQPRLTGTRLRVEIDPERRVVDIHGSDQLVNRSEGAIGSIHMTTVPDVETGAITFDREATQVLDDEALGYRIYALQEPLQPGDSLSLDFTVQVAPHGFGNGGIDASVVANGTYFTNEDWLPALGYQRNRELRDAGSRRTLGLAPRPAVPSLDDAQARQRSGNTERIAFDAVVGTAAGQIAVAPGTLRRTWTEGGRRYFHYATDAPIQNRYAFFSADYAVREARWKNVAIRIFHDPRHTANLDRMIRSARAALSYYTGHFGPYPYRYLRLIERPSQGFGLHSEAANIAYDEGFSFLNPLDASNGFDLVSSVVAHEVAHQWWGAQLPYASVEGAPLLTESLAQFSAMRVVEHSYGSRQFRRLLGFMRATVEPPPTRIAAPLLRATTDRYLWYRKGPFALYTLSRYIGETRIDKALRRLLEKHRSEASPPATSLDLYRELQAVTPDSLRPLLHDLFEANTYWQLETERATAKPTQAGTWQVTLDVRARKVVVDSAGVETEVPMDDPIEVGVFAPGEKGDALAKPLEVERRRIRSGEQTITVTVPAKPARAGIDPYRLLDRETKDPTEKVEIES